MSARFGALGSQWVGRRVEIPAYRDEWMRGARYGTVTRVSSRGLRVTLDRLPSSPVYCTAEEVRLVD
jgi:hypothetical protein